MADTARARGGGHRHPRGGVIPVAAYEYPRSLEIVDELPKTVTGKILRRELRDQAAAEPGS